MASRYICSYDSPGLTFDDILLRPGHGVLESRKDASLVSELISGFPLGLPIISANMPSVTGVEMAVAMNESGGIGALHRFQTPAMQLDQYRLVKQLRGEAIVSIGLDDIGARARSDSHILTGARIFLLDVAHADSSPVIQKIEQFKKEYDPEVSLIVGNIATGMAAERLIDAGADALKVGIGPGAACVTREVTGFGVPQFSAIREVAEATNSRVPIIADGGIKNSGDIVKAFVAGADTVMIGRLLAGTDEAPEPGRYYGNASKEMNGHNAPEGVSAQVERVGPVRDLLKQLAWGIRSGISYGGGTTIEDLRDVDWVQVSSLSMVENRARI